MGDVQHENMSPQASRLRAPSKIPAVFGRGLNELSESDNNSRVGAHVTQLPVPESTTLKHKPTNLPESDPKRVTLAQRAGTIGPSNQHSRPGSKNGASYAKPSTVSGARNTSASSSSSSRSGSTLSSRNPSGNSIFTGSVGSGALKPPSSYGSYRSGPHGAHGRNAFSVSESRPPQIPAHLNGTAAHSTLDNNAWDANGRLENMERDMKQLYGLKDQIDAATADRKTLQDTVTFQNIRINELDTIRSQLTGTMESLRTAHADLQANYNQLQTANSSQRDELDNVKSQLHDAKLELDASKRNHNYGIEDLQRKHRSELDDLRDSHRRENESVAKDSKEVVERLNRTHKDELAETERKLQTELESEKTLRQKEVQQLEEEISHHRATAEKSGAEKAREAENAKQELSRLQAVLDQEKSLNESLKVKLTESTTQIVSLDSSMQAMKAKVNFLESDSQAQSHAFGDLNKRMQEAIASAEESQAKLRAEETLRRKLHNQVQELKGNIRVFCRVRPTLESEADDTAKISYPDVDEDCKEVLVMGPEQKSALGNVTTSKNGFSFDRVFGPSSTNGEVFEEISQLVQSALDGYNVCIFCYGQTGSGKTYTMSSNDGMIPLAVNQIYATAAGLSEKGWTYVMEGSFVEVYNENINDLLGTADDLDKKKHEIRHDNARGKTTITDVNTMELDSPTTLQALLDRASRNRSVAATRANERSSRSHSVFILRLTGTNSVTGEQCEGVLNLVDLAGSERVAHSGATGERLKETQNINRSLSCLGDVVAALGQGKEGAHIPYRNSKLTYLLQHSLGGNSKTLMLVMVSPLAPHLGETLTSLKFATKVHNTHIGTAKKHTKVRDA